MNTTDKNATIIQLKKATEEMLAERDWQKFHSPKNIALKISVEAGELLEKFAWMKEEDSFAEIDRNRQEIENELADVSILILSFCNTANIDLTSAILHKLEEVKAKYPVEKVKGIYAKYNKLK